MSQWFIAAEQPPHLTCIAPLEGVADVFREDSFRGGIPRLEFMSVIQNTLRGRLTIARQRPLLISRTLGRNKQEDVAATFTKSETSNEYWEDKRARLDKIQVPAYILGSYSTGLHTLGAIRAFEEIKHKEKWYVPLYRLEEISKMTFRAFAGLPSTTLKNGSTCIQSSELKIWINSLVSTSKARKMVGSKQLPSERAFLGSIFHPLHIGSLQIFPGSYPNVKNFDYISPPVPNFLR